MRTLDDVVRQLDGEFTWRCEDGTTYDIVLDPKVLLGEINGRLRSANQNKGRIYTILGWHGQKTALVTIKRRGKRWQSNSN